MLRVQLFYNVKLFTKPLRQLPRQILRNLKADELVSVGKFVGFWSRANNRSYCYSERHKLGHGKDNVKRFAIGSASLKEHEVK